MCLMCGKEIYHFITGDTEKIEVWAFLCENCLKPQKNNKNKKEIKK